MIPCLELILVDAPRLINFSAAFACLGNIGPGLGLVGPAGNYAEIPVAGKILLSLWMLVGRLELLTVLSLFVPSLWRD